MSRESKTLSFQVKDLGVRTDESGQEFGQIEAYGAIFNNVDEGHDRILPGAFKRTIRNSKERATSRGKKYLAAMLWQHDTHEIIGGWYELSEDQTGLRAKGDISLATQRGREYYALAKAGMTDEFSIIYDVPQGGAKYDKSGVRDLSELRLFSIDPVTFAMNDETRTVAVKAADDADKKAQAARARKYGIAVKDGGNVTKPSKWADVPDAKWGDPVNYAYPMGDKAHADNAAARWGDASNRSQYSSKEQAIISRRIKRIQASYGEDTSDGKVSQRPMQRKSFEEHYADEQCKDILRDWCDVVLCAFTSAVYDAFAIGDSPEGDVNAALDALKGAVSEWVAEAVKYNLSDYLDEQASDGYDGGTASSMQYGSRGRYGYGYMSRPADDLQAKAMTAGDATTGGFTAKGGLIGPEHVEKLRGAADDASNAVSDHTKTLHTLITGVKALVEAGGDGVVEAGNANKAGRAFSRANTQALTDHADSLKAAADKLDSAVTRHMKTVSDVADDLATVLQGSESAYGTDRGTPESGQQEGKQLTRAPQRTTVARAPRTPSSPFTAADTVSEDEVQAALAALRKLHTHSA